MWGWWQTGDNLATLCGEKERQRSDAAFFLPFFPKKKNLESIGCDPRSKPPGEWEPNIFTTTPNFPAGSDGSGDAYTRENQIVLFLPLDGSATGPFRWTIPLRLIVPRRIIHTYQDESSIHTNTNHTNHPYETILWQILQKMEQNEFFALKVKLFKSTTLDL